MFLSSTVHFMLAVNRSLNQNCHGRKAHFVMYGLQFFIVFPHLMWDRAGGSTYEATTPVPAV